MSEPFVVVGGDAAGLSAASKCKREDPDREVIVYEKSQWISFAHCGMPYYVKGEVDRLADMLSLSPEAVAEREITLNRHHEVVAVDPTKQVVTVRAEAETVEQPYGDLLIATGARARTKPVDGTAYESVYTMHSMDTAAELRAHLISPETATADDDAFEAAYASVDVSDALAREPPETVAIVGGGYVGIEMAEAFRAQGLETHLYQRSDMLVPPFGEAVSEQVKETLESNGVTVHLETSIDALDGADDVEAVVTEDNRQPVDLVLLGIGIEPNTELVADTAIECGESGAIAIDDYGRTSLPNVYAAGDCAEKRHTVTGEPAWVPLGLTANRAGRAIGQTVAGDPEPVGKIAGTAVLKAFELECGRTGLVDHETATEAGFDPVSETITAGSRSGYYPGNAETTVTLVADRSSGQLLGGTIVGTDRAAIRINQVATALEAGMTVGEFEQLDLGYAPPFSPVWDPTLVGAKVLSGQLDTDR